MNAAKPKSFFRRRKSCPFSDEDAPEIDWKNPKLLSRFISERGKIVPSRITGVSQINQRKLRTAIARARQMALLAYDRNESAGGR